MWFGHRERLCQRAEKHVGNLETRKCKGVPYKRIHGRNIFVEDLQSKLYYPLSIAITHIRHALDATQLYNAVRQFNDRRIRLPWGTPQSKAWMDAYKGAGAFFTMQNLIRFHGCTAVNDRGRRLDKYQSLAFLSAKAEEYKNGEGWRLLAVLKKCWRTTISTSKRRWRHGVRNRPSSPSAR